MLPPPGAEAESAQALIGHGGPIMDIAVSPDGRHALTASFDNSVGLWTLPEGEVRWLEGHEAAVKAATFLADGLAASGGDDFAIEIWDTASGAALHRLIGHQGQVAALRASPDGTTLASASWDGTIGLWDIATGRNLRYITGHEGAVNDVAFSAGGAQLYSASADGTIRVWEAETGAPLRVLARHGFGVSALLLNPEGGWLVYGAVDGGTRALDLETGETLADLTLDRRPVLALAATGDFGRVAVGDGEGHVMVVETGRWRIAEDFRAAHRGPVWALAYAPDGARMLLGGIDDAAYVWPTGLTPQAPFLGTTERGFLRDPDEMSNGERQFRRKCSICHSLNDDGVRRAGPPLANLFGRRAGTWPGYLYSETLEDSEIIWNAETIDLLFDRGPEHYIPGTKMPMQRITGADDRADLIAFLNENTQG